jgi:hypothetical protein
VHRFGHPQDRGLCTTPAGSQLLVAEDPIPDDLRDALGHITSPEGAR